MEKLRRFAGVTLSVVEGGARSRNPERFLPGILMEKLITRRRSPALRQVPQSAIR